MIGKLRNIVLKRFGSFDPESLLNQLRFSIVVCAIMQFNYGCGGAGCGGPYHQNTFNPAPGILINSTNKPILYNDSISYVLISPKVPYSNYTKASLPLLIKYNKMVFEVVKQNNVLDSIEINYTIKPIYVKSDGCNYDTYKPAATINSCFSTGHYFSILSYSPIN
jgi:hypothetical protein